MVTELFERLKRSAKELGVNPSWLSSGRGPIIETITEFDTIDRSGNNVSSDNVSVKIVAIDAEDPGAICENLATKTFSSHPNKPTMILLHGLFGALSNWDTTINKFAEYTQPIALRLPITQGPKSDITVKSVVLTTIYFIESFGLGPVILCGNSFGGHVALRLCLLRPDLVRALILSGSSGLYEHGVDSLPARPDRDFIRDQMERVFALEEFITEEAVNDIYDIVSQKEKMLNIVHAARSAKKDYLEKLLPLINVPTLLLWGECDRITTPTVANRFNQLIPNSSLVFKDRCGHAPMIEHPEWFSSQVKSFLSGANLLG